MRASGYRCHKGIVDIRNEKANLQHEWWRVSTLVELFHFTQTFRSTREHQLHTRIRLELPVGPWRLGKLRFDPLLWSSSLEWVYKRRLLEWSLTRRSVCHQCRCRRSSSFWARQCWFNRCVNISCFQVWREYVVWYPISPFWSRNDRYSGYMIFWVTAPWAKLVILSAAMSISRSFSGLNFIYAKS